LPRRTIFSFSVMRARTAASRFIGPPPMQNGVAWCEFSITPSKPTCSRYSFSSKYRWYRSAPISGR
jgi:hypothetical protein